MKRTLKRYLMLATLTVSCVLGFAVNEPPCNPPTITSQTGDQSLCGGDTAVFSVTASGTEPLSYQWYKNGSEISNDGRISGATSPTLTITAITTGDAGDYSVRVQNNCASVLGASSHLTVEGNRRYQDVVLPGSAALFWSGDKSVTFSYPEEKVIVGYMLVDEAPFSDEILWWWASRPYKCAVMASSSGDPAATLAVQPLKWLINPWGSYHWLEYNGYYPWNYWDYYPWNLNEVIGHYYFRFHVGAISLNVIPAQLNSTTATASKDYTFSFADGNQYRWRPGAIRVFPVERISTCEISPQLPLVEFSPASGYVLPLDVSLSVPDHPGATIYYTVDGTIPTRFSQQYTPGTPVPLPSSATITAFAVENGLLDSPIASVRYGGDPVEILRAPKPRTVVVGNDATFTVQAWGSAPMSYQWRRNGADLANGGSVSGAQSATLRITGAQMTDAANYSVKVWNPINEVHTTPVALTVINPTPPVITAQPASKVVAPGDSVTFSVGVGQGTPPLTYQWHKTGESPIPGATDSSYTLTDAQLPNNGEQYWVVIANQWYPAGVTSHYAKLTVMEPNGVDVSIEADPGLAVTAGNQLTLSAVVLSVTPVTYQWQFKPPGSGQFADLLGENKPYLHLANAQLGHNGSYKVIVKNTAGGQDNASASLVVTCVLNPNDNCGPYFTDVEELELPALNGTYTLSMETLLPPNSDAMNLTAFKVTSVVSGRLLINGNDFNNPANCTIGAGDWATWIPPVVLNPEPVAFKARATDGTVVTDTDVDVVINHKPKTRLFGWGINDKAQVGNGRYWNYNLDPNTKHSPWIYSFNLEAQASLGILPKLPRWQPYPAGVFWIETQPQLVLDAPDVVSVASEYGNSAAVGVDGAVWVWGEDLDFLFGKPFVFYSWRNPDERQDHPDQLWRWGQPEPEPSLWQKGGPFRLGAPSPIPYEKPRSDGASEQLLGVSKIERLVNSSIALKKDGTVWSWGFQGHGGELGREPRSEDDRFDDGWMPWGMSPRRVEIDGDVVDIDANLSSVVALCDDGKLWWWGSLYDAYWVKNGSDWHPWNYSLSDELSEFWRPKRLIQFDNLASPLIRVATDGNHFVGLAADGDVFEFGYIPRLDNEANNAVARPAKYTSASELDDCHSKEPVFVAGLPDDGAIPGSVVSVAAGEYFGVALTDLADGGNVWVWGYFGPDNLYTAPKQIPPQWLSGIEKIAVNGRFILALDKRGQVWGWGRNDYGILRGEYYGDTEFVEKPVRIRGIEGVEAIFAGYQNAFAVGVAENKDRIKLNASPGAAKVTLRWSSFPAAKEYVIYRTDETKDWLDDSNYDGDDVIGTTKANEFHDYGPNGDVNDPTLDNGKTYYYKVAALVNGVEMGKSWEESATPLPLPSGVQALFTANQCRGVTLTWNQPVNAVASRVTQYRILRASVAGPNDSAPPDNAFYFLGIRRADATTLSYFDDQATPGAGNYFYYKVVAVNTSGDSSPVTSGPLPAHVDTGNCAPAPYIATAWKANPPDAPPAPWFEQTRFDTDPTDSTAGYGTKATLYWAIPSGGWGPGGVPTGFRIRYRYTRNGMPFGQTYFHDVSEADLAMDAQRFDPNAPPSYLVNDCYSFTWDTSGLNCYASVAAIVNGQEGISSIEVGPASISGEDIQWTGKLRATPGHEQVYLEWPDNEKLCEYTVLSTSTRPGRTPSESGANWDTVETGITDPRYWDTWDPGLILPLDVSFSASDINIDYAANLAYRLQDNSGYLLATAIVGRWDSAQQQAFTANPTDRSVLADGLNQAVQWENPNTDKKEVFFAGNPEDFKTVDDSSPGGVFTPKTRELFDRRDDLSESEKCLLNRLIIEETYSYYGVNEDWVASMGAFKYYRIEATICGDTTTVPSDWVQGRPDDQATPRDASLALNVSAYPYVGMVSVEWNLSKTFAGIDEPQDLSLGYSSVQVVSATRYNSSGSPVATGTEGTHYSLSADPTSGAVIVEILAGSNLICGTGDEVRIVFSPMSSATDWQFSLERKPDAVGASYERITEIGFGLAYLDKDVVNGTKYWYRVTATDKHYNYWQAETATAVAPGSDAAFVLNAEAGNGYVDLAWTPVRASRYVVEHSLSPDRDFRVVGSLDAENRFLNPPNTHRHVGAKNGVDNYYKIVATLSSSEGGAAEEMESPVVKARPSASLPPLAPTRFTPEQIKDSSGRRFLLTWNTPEGVGSYQVFVRENASLVLIYEGNNPRCYFALPADIQADLNGSLRSANFRFAIRSLNFDGVAGDIREYGATWIEDGNTPSEDTTVARLKVAGQFGVFGQSVYVITPDFVGPTNLTLSVDISLPNVKRVSFFSNGELLGTTEAGRTEFLWRQVTGGSHELYAKVEAGELGGTTFSTVASYTTPTVTIFVNILPELSAFQTAVTDLQLPAPGLPITLSRSYTSRSTTKGDRGLAVGWEANWLAPSIEFSTDIGTGWKGAVAPLLEVPHCFLAEQDPHLVTVTLAQGQEAYFQPTVMNPPEREWFSSDKIDLKLQPFSPGQGKLTGIAGGDITSHPDPLINHTDWATESDVTFEVAFDKLGGTDILTYTTDDETKFIFERIPNNNLTWRLRQVADRNGNTLNYSYLPTGNPNAGKLESITHSCGRKVTFDYPTANKTHVFDSLGGANPVLKYAFDPSGFLTNVQHLVDRSGSGTYESTTYRYGTSGDDLNRLTAVFDARHIRVLANAYQGEDGDLDSQTDAAGRTTEFILDSETKKLTVTREWTENGQPIERTAEVRHDDSGAISSVAQSADDGSMQTASTFIYKEGLLVAQRDADNRTRTFDYDHKDRLIGQTDENGNGTNMRLTDDGQPDLTWDAKENETVYMYDKHGNPFSVKDPSGTTTAYTYLETKTVTDPSPYTLGIRTRSERRQAPFVPFTIVSEYAYYGDDETDTTHYGDLKSITEKWVQLVNGADATVGTPITTWFEYDANGNRTVEIKHRTTNGLPEYIRTKYNYDAKGRVKDTLIETATSLNGTWASVPNTSTHTDYNALGKPASTTDGYNRTTVYTYDVSGNLIETFYPDNTVTRTTYDHENRTEYVQDRVRVDNTTAPATKTTYDAAGRVAKVERFGSVTLTKAQDTDFVSDGTVPTQYKMTASSAADLLTTTRTFYDNVGRVQFSVDARNVVSESVYDPGGRRTNFIVYTGYSGVLRPVPSQLTHVSDTHYAYDPNGNQTSVTVGITAYDSISGEPLDGQTTTYEYDKANRVILTTFPTTDDGPTTRSTAYDGLGRRIQETDENSVSTAYGYDFRGLLTSVTIGLGTPQAATTSYAYDELGNQTNQVDALGRETRYVYDTLGRRTSRTLPDNATETVSYSAVPDPEHAGIFVQRRAVTDFRGKTILVTNDWMDRIKTKAMPGVNGEAGTTNRYVYSAVGLLERVDVSGHLNRSTYYAYDGQRRLQRKDTPEGVLAYTYDAVGALETIKGYRRTAVGVNAAPGSATPDVDLTYDYDSLGRLWKATDNKLAAPNNVTTYAYDPLGNLDWYTYPNGVKHDYAYNERNRLTELAVTRGNDTLLRRYEYTLSPTGLRTGVTEKEGSEVQRRRVSYQYDGATLPTIGRLTKESLFNASDAPNGTITHTYDPVGNRTARTVAGVTSVDSMPSQTFNFDQRDWLDGDSEPENANDRYDENGNTKKNDAGFATGDQYDAENRLIQRGSGTSITYDHDGHRVRKTVTIGVTAVTTHYLVDDRNPSGYAQVLAEYETTEPESTGLVGHWKLDDATGSTATDSSNSDSHGTLSGSPLWTNGPAMGALNFDGINDSVSVANHTSLQLGVNHTIAFWLKKNSEPSGWQRLIGKGIDTQRNYTIWDAASGDTRLYYSLHTGAGHFGLYSTSGLEVNRWYHVVATYDGSAQAFHLNGTPSGSAAANGTPVTSIAALLFGYAGYAGTYMSGALDDVRLYQRTLTAGEIAGLSPQLKRRYTYGHDLISQTTVGTSTTTHYYGYDGHGSVRLLLSSASGADTQITDTYDYDAYGQLLAKTGTTVNHYRYTGEQWDSNLGMYYLRARYLNPNTGRFWTMDSYEGKRGRPSSLHKYLYVSGNPINRIDPSGHMENTMTLSVGMYVRAVIAVAVVSYVGYQLVTKAPPISVPTIWITGSGSTSTGTNPSPRPNPNPQPDRPPPVPVPVYTEEEQEDHLSLYRGVPTTSDQYPDAQSGIAKPRGTRLDRESLILHIIGMPSADAGVTSWTTKRGYAKTRATSDGNVGRVLEVDLLAVTDLIVPRPTDPRIAEFDYENEVLLKGVIYARSTIP